MVIQLQFYGKAGLGTELSGYDIGATAFSVPLQGEIPISADLCFVIGIDIKLFSASSCFKVEKGKLEFGD